jgi:plasmid stabilization system protein ParE
VDRFFADYTETINLLAQFPYAGREREDTSHGLRSYPAYPYVIFYRVFDDLKKAVIVTIVHGAMDINAEFA